jgi:hypothetical protein
MGRTWWNEMNGKELAGYKGWEGCTGIKRKEGRMGNMERRKMERMGRM